jgi:iron complex transport system permease protein
VSARLPATEQARSIDHRTPTRARRVGLVGGLILLLVASVLVGLGVGSVAIAPRDVLQTLAANLGFPVDAPSTTTDTIVWLIRAPRVVLGAVIGAGLATCGATLQAVVRNPIADPFLLGISSGAAVGAVLVVSFGVFASLGIWALSTAAFIGAVIAAAAVLAMSRRRGALSPLRIILAGTAISYACSALSSLLIFKSRHAEAAQAVLFWLLGSLAGASWSRLWIVTPMVVTGIVVLWALGRHLNALLAGDDTAAALGVDVARLRQWFIILTALMTATMVAVSGAIGFVGLLLPHAGRFLVGNDHRRLLPVVALLGASFLVLVDVAGRTIASPQEIPIGVLTAALGTPFFLWLLVRADRQGGLRP